MRVYQVNLTEPARFETVSRESLAHRFCPVDSAWHPAPLEEIYLLILLPGGRRTRVKARAVSYPSTDRFMAELLEPLELAGRPQSSTSPSSGSSASLPTPNPATSGLGTSSATPAPTPIRTPAEAPAASAVPSPRPDADSTKEMPWPFAPAAKPTQRPSTPSPAKPEATPFQRPLASPGKPLAPAPTSAPAEPKGTASSPFDTLMEQAMKALEGGGTKGTPTPKAEPTKEQAASATPAPAAAPLAQAGSQAPAKPTAAEDSPPQAYSVQGPPPAPAVASVETPRPTQRMPEAPGVEPASAAQALPSQSGYAQQLPAQGSQTAQGIALRPVAPGAAPTVALLPPIPFPPSSPQETIATTSRASAPVSSAPLTAAQAPEAPTAAPDALSTAAVALASSLFAPLPPNATVVPLALGWPPAISLDDMAETVAAPGDSGFTSSAQLASPSASSFETLQGVEVSGLSLSQQQALASTGDRNVRERLLQAGDPGVHVLVLLNSAITLDEVRDYASRPTLSADALRLIATTAEWRSDRGVFVALVKNPATPPDAAQAMLKSLKPDSLRVLSQSPAVPETMRNAARELLQQIR